MNNVEIIGYGYSLPKNTVQFGKQTRYRSKDGETQLSLCTNAAKNALSNAEITINDVDCIISACAVIIQPIPCNAAVIHNELSAPNGVPAIDICTTCSSFITAFDMVSYLIDSGRYNTVLLVSGDMSSIALPEDDKHVFELFSDGAAAAVIQKSETKGIISAYQRTYSQGINLTSIVSGGTSDPPYNYSPERDHLYRFQMNGLGVAELTVKVLKRDFETFMSNAGFTRDDIDVIVPHQVSTALPSLMKYMGFPKDKYLNYVSDFGNMVSASVPFALCKGIELGRIKKGDRVLLLGTAAGLTVNLLYFIY